MKTPINKALINGLTKHLNKAYSIGADDFESMDRSISHQAKEFGNKSILDFVTVKD